MKRLFLFLFLMSCAAPNSNYNIKNEILDFNKDLTFDEFNLFLKDYSNKADYPDINE